MTDTLWNKYAGTNTPLFVVGGQLMVLGPPPFLSDHSDEYCRLVALTYQEGDDMTLTSIPDLTVANNRKGHLAWSSFKFFVFLLVQPCNIPEMKTRFKIRGLPSTEKLNHSDETIHIRTLLPYNNSNTKSVKIRQNH